MLTEASRDKRIYTASQLNSHDVHATCIVQIAAVYAYRSILMNSAITAMILHLPAKPR